MLHCKGNNL
ncbi:Protein EvgL [Escherichia coli]|uniref:Protein EvgL n=1 Tax=Escherichia coli (strain K12) TaxID=83333 RepID=EVGL_ECOLI|nr:protein EvgL [Escherichia coli str. K-12 substr. MG1655] [Escherichia coli]YP_010051191.1 protein EvgL [Escherichia coli str. K-12 substr. MG1655]P0DSF9.1 RecName: Full=Protein EvgL [Escherichia coli K-12]QNV50534.1 protein EvgL [Escherichia coli str. K-12 substr. MG1655]CAI4144799.1 Protein EvgL [Escherichia coli]CAI6170249.1 Protein EvgL [Escherichia coli]CAI6170335.1 Protein EvgL [Escherichia coli]CAI6171229.1 Protein EvgL [Escherichia coli]